MLKQALKSKDGLFVRPSLVINHDQLGTGGSNASSESGNDATSPSLSPAEAEARKQDDYWADKAPIANHVESGDGDSIQGTNGLDDDAQSSPISLSQTRQQLDDNGLVGRAVDIVSSARGMFRGIFNNSRE